MPRYNIEHKGKYYIFSSICDGIIEEFDSFEGLQNYRLLEYGRGSFDNEKSFKELRGNKEELKEVLAAMINGGNETNENIIRYFSLLDRDEMVYAYKDLMSSLDDIRSD